MRDFLTVLRHELRLLRTSVGTYIFLSFGWVALGVCTFYLGDFFGSNQAHLSSFFSFHPWVYLLFLPALAMNSWAQEWRNNTAERLLTLPLHPLAVTMGKFMALWLLVGVMLLGTWPMVATVMWLGEPDLGPIISGYLGSFLVAGAMLAVALWANILGRAPAAGFVLGVVMLFVLLASGWGFLMSLLEGTLPQSVIQQLVNYSILDRYRNFTYGLIDLRDVVFYLSILTVFLTFSHAALLLRLERGRVWLKAISPVILALLAAVAVHFTIVRLDTTQERLHTLSATSQQLLAEVDVPLTMTFYFSSSNSGVPVPAHQFARRIEDFMQTMHETNPEHITVITIDPEQDIDQEIAAVEAQVREIPLPTGEGFYFGLVMEQGGRKTIIPAFEPARLPFLEFDLMSAITELGRTKRKNIGVVTELNLGVEGQRPRFMNELLANYRLHMLPKGEASWPNDLDLVIVFLSPFMTPESVYALDQYMVNGGKVLLFMDPFMRTAPAEDLQTPDRNADAWAVDHPADLLRKWGVDYDYRQVVGDRARAVPVQLEGVGLTTYPLWLYLSHGEINKDLPFMSFVSDLLWIESGFFTQQDIPATLTYEAAIQSPETSQTVDRSLFDELDVQVIGGELRGEERVRDLSMLLTGNFPSAYEQVPQAVKDYYSDYADDPEQVVIPPHTTLGDKPGAIMAVADMDFLSDEYALTYERVGEREIMRPANDNLVFLFNAIQYLLGDTALLPIRGKAVHQRTFIQVDTMLRQVAGRFQSLEQQLAEELFGITQRLATLQREAQAKPQLDAKIQAEIKAFQAKELELKKQLRDVRRGLRRDIDALGRALALINMLLMPMATLFFAIWFFWHRRR